MSPLFRAGSLPSLPGSLGAAGFETRAFVDVGGYLDPRFGMGRGFDAYKISSHGVEVSNPERFAWLNELAQRQAEDTDHRFFYFLHYYDPHSDVGTQLPYASPPAYAGRYWPEGLAWNRKGDTQLLIDLQDAGDVSAQDREAIAALYDGSARYCDEVCLGSLLDHLERLGHSDETLVIVTADHGEEIYEHGKCSHQQPYEETSRVPWVMRGPGIPKGLRLGFDVQHIDLMPTVLGMLGLEIPPDVQGRDLSPWLAAVPPREPPADAPVFVDGVFGGLPTVYWRYPSAVISREDGRRYSLVTRVKYAESQPGGGFQFSLPWPRELYDLDADPEQTRDIGAELPAIRDRLGEALLRWYAGNEELRRKAARRVGEEAPILDAAERERLRALGYLHEDAP
jgi:arylsulfatase